MGVATSSLLQEYERFFRQAEASMPTALELSLSAYQDFLAQAEWLLKSDQPLLLNECQAFLTQAEKMLSPSLPSLAELRDFFDEAQRLLVLPTVSLEECQAFLQTAEEHLLEHWRRQIEWLREADPRDRPDFQAVNLLDIFGISRQEAPHSRFLGWLLDPQGNHGLGTAFLDSFFRLAQRTCGCEFDADLSDVEVKLERGTDRGIPDITILGSNFLCIVENKLLAAEGRDQTQRYADAAEEEARKRGVAPANLLLVFLSPEGRSPKDNRFRALAYPPLLQLLEDLLDRDTLPIVEVAIRQSVFNLRARVLHAYDQAMAVLTHLTEYAEKGDPYLKKHWAEIDGLVQALRR